MKDIERLGKAVQKETPDKVVIYKLVSKLEKDSMKIGEAIYKNVDQTEIDKIEKEANQMPPDDEVVSGLKEFLSKAIDDLNTYGEQIE